MPSRFSDPMNEQDFQRNYKEKSAAVTTISSFIGFDLPVFHRRVKTEIAHLDEPAVHAWKNRQKEKVKLMDECV